MSVRNLKARAYTIVVLAMVLTTIPMAITHAQTSHTFTSSFLTATITTDTNFSAVVYNIGAPLTGGNNKFVVTINPVYLSGVRAFQSSDGGATWTPSDSFKTGCNEPLRTLFETNPFPSPFSKVSNNAQIIQNCVAGWTNVAFPALRKLEIDRRIADPANAWTTAFVVAGSSEAARLLTYGFTGGSSTNPNPQAIGTALTTAQYTIASTGCIIDMFFDEKCNLQSVACAPNQPASCTSCGGATPFSSWDQLLQYTSGAGGAAILSLGLNTCTAPDPVAGNPFYWNCGGVPCTP